MLSLKVKVEKPDLEATSARSRLDAVLQGLLERSEGDREVLEDDAGKAVGDAVPKDASPSAPGKRASRRFPPHRRKKRREAEEGQPDPPLQRPNTYVIKLFDRSVDLGQFSEGTPLYPVCRAWMRNCPTGRPQICPTAPESAPHLQGAAPGAALHVGPHLQQHGEVEARPAEVEGSVAPAAAALWRQPAPPPPHLRAPVKPRPFRPAQPISAFFSPSPRPRVFSQPIDVGSSPSNHVAWARCHRGARRGLVGARRRGAWPGGFIH
ncbi:protein lin-37 homolog isoform X11 [Gallus gallus]|uniref:protein lin-37 homolog isoform X11 n=1 Tax=Gallus gallus TaxID=9031 RepID=UPI001AE85849|nr:protein lin-37 homolog isoform X11 [Gallus gallus]XP_040551179.1 protein lin-37 homolog isoform X11 [Gallus gallus]